MGGTSSYPVYTVADQGCVFLGLKVDVGTAACKKPVMAFNAASSKGSIYIALSVAVNLTGKRPPCRTKELSIAHANHVLAS